MLDFLRVAAAVPPLAVGDVKTNTAQILNMAKKAHEEGAQVVVFPELSLCGYTCGDLFFQQALLQGVKEGLAFLLSQTAAGVFRVQCTEETRPASGGSASPFAITYSHNPRHLSSG